MQNYSPRRSLIESNFERYPHLSFLRQRNLSGCFNPNPALFNNLYSRQQYNQPNFNTSCYPQNQQFSNHFPYNPGHEFSPPNVRFPDKRFSVPNVLCGIGSHVQPDTSLQNNTYKRPHALSNCGTVENETGKLTRLANREKHVSTDFFCDLCNVNCAGKQCYDAHIIGQKHAKKESRQRAIKELKLDESGDASDSDLFRCALCCINCTGVDTFKAHISGRVHQRSVRIQQHMNKKAPHLANTLDSAENSPNSEMLTYTASPNTHANNSQNFLSVNNKDVSPIDDSCIKEIQSGKSIVFCCSICNCCFSDSRSKTIHLNGRKHVNRLRNQKKIKTPTINKDSYPTPNPTASMPWAPSLPKAKGQFFNDLVNFPNRRIIFPHHSTSDEHYMNMKLKQILPTDAEQLVMMTAISACEDGLNKISKEDANKLDDDICSSPNAESDINGVYRTGAFVTGLILTGTNTADLVCICNEWPHAEYINSISSRLEQLIKDECEDFAVTVASHPEDAALSVNVAIITKENSMEENSEEPTRQTNLTVLIHISFTSLLVLKHQKRQTLSNFSFKQQLQKVNLDDSYEANDNNDDGDVDDGDVDDGDDNDTDLVKEEDEEIGHFGEVLSCIGVPETQCLDALTEVRRALWLQTMFAKHPAPGHLVNVTRLLWKLLEKKDGCQFAKPTHTIGFAFLVLVERISYLDIVRSVRHGVCTTMYPDALFRRVLEVLASGVLLIDGELSSLSDPSEMQKEQRYSAFGHIPKSPPLFGQLSTEEREEITLCAQTSLRLLTFNKIYEALDLPKSISDVKPEV